MPSALRLISTGCLFSLLIFWAMLSASNLLSPWPVLSGPTDEPLPVILAQPVGSTPQPRSVGGPPPPPLVLAVSIPSVSTPFIAGAPPLSVTASTGGHAAAPVTQAPGPDVRVGPLPAVLRTPAGAGPFPAVVLLHGCDGPFTGVPDWAYRLNAWGYAVLMPDSMTPRGVHTVCNPTDQPKVTPLDRVGDVAASVAWLRARPEIDPVRLAVLGLSHGGVTAVLATETTYAGMRLRAAIDYHGPCQEPRLHGSVPLLVLAGEADDRGDPAARCRAYGAALGPDQPFEIHTYPGVYHAFDGGPASKTVNTGHVVAYDKAAAVDSFARVRTFLDRQVRF
jgi:dienelactone hydrolase